MVLFRPLQAVIWDMDGVLVDSLPTHVEAWQIILTRYGYQYTYEQMIPVFGMNDVSVLSTLTNGRFTEEEQKTLAREKESIYQDLIGREIKSLPGVSTWLENFRDGGLKQTLASSSTRESISIILKNLHIDSFFDIVVSGEGFPSKPNPFIFLKAAEKLNIQPENLLVIEDSAVGVEAAKTAGMYCLAVTTTTTKEELKKADLVVNRLNQLTIPLLESIFSR